MLWTEIVSLEEHHEVDLFCCGLESIDAWFREKAYANRHHVTTNLCTRPPELKIMAFFSLKTVIVSTEGMNSAQRAGTQNGQATGILLCFMGVDQEFQGNGAGKRLVIEAMTNAVQAHNLSPVNLFVVDAENEKLIPFYQKMGLKLIPGTSRLVAPMKTIKKFVEANH